MEQQAIVYSSNLIDGVRNEAIIIDDSVVSSDEMIISINESNDSIIFVAESSLVDQQNVPVCEESVDNINNFSCPVFESFDVDVNIAGPSTNRNSPVNSFNHQKEENVDADLSNLSIGMANISSSEEQLQPIVMSAGRTVTDTVIGQQLIGLVQKDSEVSGSASIGFDKKPTFGFSSTPLKSDKKPNVAAEQRLLNNSSDFDHEPLPLDFDHLPFVEEKPVLNDLVAKFDVPFRNIRKKFTNFPKPTGLNKAVQKFSYQKVGDIDDQVIFYSELYNNPKIDSNDKHYNMFCEKFALIPYEIDQEVTKGYRLAQVYKNDQPTSNLVLALSDREVHEFIHGEGVRVSDVLNLGFIFT